MDTKDAKTLPKMLPGVVCTEWKKCGKPTGRCAQAKQAIEERQDTVEDSA